MVPGVPGPAGSAFMVWVRGYRPLSSDPLPLGPKPHAAPTGAACSQRQLI